MRLPMRLAVAVTLAIGAAHAADPVRPPSASPSFTGDIQPLFDRRCVICHRSDDPVGGLILERGTAYEQIVRSPSTESALMRVAPGKPDQSYLQLKIEGKHGAAGKGFQMPPHANPLPEDEQQLVRNWISHGARRN